MKCVGSSSTHANTQRPTTAALDDDDDDELDQNETVEKMSSDLRSNLSRLVAKLAVEIEQMHDEQRERGCSCDGGCGRQESDESGASGGSPSARQRALNAILELIRDIKASLGGGDASTLTVSHQVYQERDALLSEC